MQSNQHSNAKLFDSVRTLAKGAHIDLQNIWMEYFHRGTRWENGNAEHWFTSVLDFLERRGDEVIPNGLRNLEERIVASGKSEEYLAALTEVVAYSPLHTDHDRAVLVLTATVEEREKALRKVLT